MPMQCRFTCHYAGVTATGDFTQPSFGRANCFTNCHYFEENRLLKAGSRLLWRQQNSETGTNPFPGF
ncbi:hypothetical protein Psta_1429 [Pirellula staleyi DSM 6068]|uniref:Uncharacterized protein n=1 Tax=Pirellula staleyi (strain ATCC 27377 / DSM 6068 / ICPB 4128) TaxID=530564 RepID=D2QX00_PIRSD|nr:hypothetical protein Psta_1429 [Pirellula staleyi DSM 6068]